MHLRFDPPVDSRGLGALDWYSLCANVLSGLPGLNQPISERDVCLALTAPLGDIRNPSEPDFEAHL